MKSRLIVLLSLFAGSTMAALPASVGTSITSIQTDGLALADLVWPALLALTGAVILFKLVKRFINKI